MVDAAWQHVGPYPIDDVFGCPGDAEPVGQLVRGTPKRLGHVAACKRLADRFHLGVGDAVSLHQLRGHRGQVERGLGACGDLGGLTVL